MVLTLVGASSTTCTRRAAVVLKLTGTDFKFRSIDLFSGEHKTAAHLEKQPFGQVPYLDDDGFIVYESRAIARYIARKAGNTTLLPVEPKAATAFDQAASVEVANFDPCTFGVIQERVFKPMFGKPTDEQRYESSLETLNNKLDGYERILAKTKYLAGNELTLVDLFHLPNGDLLTKAGVDALSNKAKYPSVARWWKELATLPAWQEVKDEFKP